MLANERKERILEILRTKGAATTVSISRMLNVSVETVRKDLLVLEHSGELLRVHGGAVLPSKSRVYENLDKRQLEHADEKRELAETAAAFVSEGDVISIDSGSTAVAFAEALVKHFSKLTVITHSADVFEIISRQSDFELILCGGNYLKSENAFYGVFASRALSDLHAQKAFVFPSAISLKRGITDYQPQLIEMQKLLFTNASKVFVLADSSKFEKSALYKLSDTLEKYVYISDSSMSAELKCLYRNSDIRIVTNTDEVKEIDLN